MYPSRIVPSSWSPPGTRPDLALVRSPRPTSPYLALVRECAQQDYGSAAAGPDGQRADELLELSDRIAELARSIQVAEAEMMRLIVEFDARRGWADAGFPSCAEWLAWRVGVRLNAARERVRTARALAELPLASAAMAEGELSYAKARALTRVATAESEKELLALAEAGSAENLERVVRAWKAMDDAQELTVEQVRHRNRRFSVFVDDDGSYVVNGRLDPEAGAMLMRAVEAASDALFREKWKGQNDSADGDGEPASTDTTPSQRRADAVGLLAERTLAVGFRDDTRGTRAERYQVLLHVEPDTLVADRPSGRSELDGGRVCRETARRLTCDAGVAHVTAVTSDDPGAAATSDDPATAATSGGRSKAVASVGRRTRTVPPALRRALHARDRGCRFPGCGSRFVDAHHIVHWADGGPTALPNLVLLCRRHHRAVHEDGMRICMDRDAAVVFFTDAGRALTGAPAPSAHRARALPSPPASLTPDPGAARFRRDGDIPWHIEARAWEALDAG